MACLYKSSVLHALLPLSPPYLVGERSRILVSLSTRLGTHALLSPFIGNRWPDLLQVCAVTTIAGYPSRLAWAGYGRQWLSSGLLGSFDSCPYSDMYSFPLLYIGSYVMYLCNLGSLESLLYKCFF